MVDVSISVAQTTKDFAECKALFLEYASTLDFDLAFQGFEEEMANFPGIYGESEGALVLARVDGEPAGTVGLRMQGRDADIGVICEMKRLYVRGGFRKLGLGRKLAVAISDEARRIGYAAMRLDTVASMQEAIALYRSLGFYAIDRYNHSPTGQLDNAEYFQLILS